MAIVLPRERARAAPRVYAQSFRADRETERERATIEAILKAQAVPNVTLFERLLSCVSARGTRGSIDDTRGKKKRGIKRSD